MTLRTSSLDLSSFLLQAFVYSTFLSFQVTKEQVICQLGLNTNYEKDITIPHENEYSLKVKKNKGNIQII